MKTTLAFRTVYSQAFYNRKFIRACVEATALALVAALVILL